MKGYLYDNGDEIIVRKESAGGVVAHLSETPIEIEIDDVTYDCYPLDKTYKDMTENVAMVWTRKTDIRKRAIFSISVKDPQLMRVILTIWSLLTRMKIFPSTQFPKPAHLICLSHRIRKERMI